MDKLTRVIELFEKDPAFAKEWSQDPHKALVARGLLGDPKKEDALLQFMKKGRYPKKTTLFGM